MSAVQPEHGHAKEEHYEVLCGREKSVPNVSGQWPEEIHKYPYRCVSDKETECISPDNSRRTVHKDKEPIK